MKALKKDLLELLRHDTAVQQCIQDIIKQSHPEHAETPKDAAGNALTERCKLLEQQVQQLQAQLKNLQPLEPLQPLWEAYTRYQHLSPDTLQSLQGIFPQNTLSVFISAGLQQKNLEAFYDYIKNAIVEGDNPDQDALIKLFHTLLEYFLQAHPRYEIEHPEQCLFDPTQHIKTPNSPPSGSIKHVQLAGWKIKNNQKIIKQAIVQL